MTCSRDVKASAGAFTLAFLLAACATGPQDMPRDATATPSPSTDSLAAPPTLPPSPTAPETLLETVAVVTGDVADWPGAWSPDSRFYVFFRWRADDPCSGESIHAYDTILGRDIELSSPDYCTRDVDPDLAWEGDSTLLLGDGPDGERWEAITLAAEVSRAPLDGAPNTCLDRDIPLPAALDGLDVSRARRSPDESSLAIAVVPDDDTRRFENIPGNRDDLHLFQRLDLAVFPIDGTDESDLRWLGPIFDVGPDDAVEGNCPGTQLRWSEGGQMILSTLGPVVYEAASGKPLLAPDGPNAGPLGPNRRWSPDDRRVADDFQLLDLRNGEQHNVPGILPGYDRGFASNDQLIYINEIGLSQYDVETRASRQLTDFRLAVFVVAPDGNRLAYADNGDLWMLDLDG